MASPVSLNLVLMLVCTVFLADIRAESSLHVCESPAVRVRSPDSADVVDACNGAADALAFFASLGLFTDDAVVVEIVSKLPDNVGHTAVGCYLEQTDRVLILPYSEFAKHQTWFNVPIDRHLYRSLATHEVAHALADCQFAIPNPSIEAKEYIAYVATFYAMHPATRTRVLQATPGTGFDSEMKINAVLYLFDPMRFGAEAYRHYRKAGNGPDFLRAVLAGEALAD